MAPSPGTPDGLACGATRHAHAAPHNPSPCKSMMAARPGFSALSRGVYVAIPPGTGGGNPWHRYKLTSIRISSAHCRGRCPLPGLQPTTGRDASFAA